MSRVATGRTSSHHNQALHNTAIYPWTCLGGEVCMASAIRMSEESVLQGTIPDRSTGKIPQELSHPPRKAVIPSHVPQAHTCTNQQKPTRSRLRSLCGCKQTSRATRTIRIRRAAFSGRPQLASEQLGWSRCVGTNFAQSCTLI
jgi:hypothetical protein